MRQIVNAYTLLNYITKREAIPCIQVLIFAGLPCNINVLLTCLSLFTSVSNLQKFKL